MDLSDPDGKRRVCVRYDGEDSNVWKACNYRLQNKKLCLVDCLAKRKLWQRVSEKTETLIGRLAHGYATGILFMAKI